MSGTVVSLGLIGFGSIAGLLVKVLGDRLPEPLRNVEVLVRPGTDASRRREIVQACEAMCRHCEVHDEGAAFIAAKPMLVIECAGHEAVAEHAESVLAAGLDMVIGSVGALGDAELYDRLINAARSGATRLIIPSGAIGALDILAALKLAGIRSVRYRSRKHPRAWQGTPAEDLHDLQNLAHTTVFYDGSAREAVRDYPKNANVAAALSLAGIGFDDTAVQLIADPAVTDNTHEFDVVSEAGTVSLRIEGRVSPDNPKTSLPTVYSLAREVLNRVGPVVV